MSSLRRRLVSLVVLIVAGLACDDALPTTNVGGLVFVIRTFQATSGKFKDIDRVVVDVDRVEVVHDGGGKLVVDTHARQIVLPNLDRETIVAQYQAPPGKVSQLRVFAAKLTLIFKDERRPNSIPKLRTCRAGGTPGGSSEAMSTSRLCSTNSPGCGVSSTLTTDSFELATRDGR